MTDTTDKTGATDATETQATQAADATDTEPTNAQEKKHRRGRGEGSIIKVGSKYYGRLVENGHVIKKPLSRNLREAQALWREWLRQRHPEERGTLGVKFRDTWPQLAEYYRGQGVRDRALVVRKGYWTRIVAYFAELGLYKPSEVAKGNVVDMLEQVGAGLSSATRRRLLYVLRDIYAVCLPDVKSPTVGVRVSVPEEEVQVRIPLDDAQVRKLLDRAEQEGHVWKVLVEVALYTGLRLKDCVLLRTDEIVDGAVQLRPRKTRAHGTIVRIPLHPALKAELDGLGVEDGYYFPELVDQYESQGVYRHLRRVFSSAIGETAATGPGRKRPTSVRGFHSLRSTFISRLAQAGVSLPMMQSIAGHLQPAQTMHYTHPDEASKQAAIGTLPNFDTGAPSPEPKYVPQEVRVILDECARRIREVMAEKAGAAPDDVEVDVEAVYRRKGSQETHDLAMRARDLWERAQGEDVRRGIGLFYSKEEEATITTPFGEVLQAVAKGGDGKVDEAWWEGARENLSQERP